jgi:hypothetical protein
MRKEFVLALAGLLLLCVLGFTQTARKQKGWEYKVEYSPKNTTEKLNELGAEGWELTTATEVRYPDVGSAGLGRTLYFKRPKQ